MRIFAAILAFVFLVFNNASASPIKPWQIGLQEAATPVMEKFVSFHNMLLVIIFIISFFVLGLLTYVCLRFRAKANPIPSKTTHNTLLEIIWTALPVIILLVIAIPSMRTLYFANNIENADMTLKVTGYQWYWGYTYPDQGIAEYRSDIIKDEDIKEGQIRLLSVDNKVILPINKNIRIQTTGADVIHNWAIPSFGIKIDAVPGRLNETWIRITKAGTYYGQCSELCGKGHGFMPIQIEAVTEAQFKEWVEKKKKES